MQLINETRYQSRSISGAAEGDRMGVVVIAKATYEIGEDGSLELATSDPWPVHFDNLETPYGVFSSEYTPYYKPRVDFILCGHARARSGRSVRSMTVTFRVGEGFSREVSVVGDRHWTERSGRLVPSEPEPFSAIPLILEKAYGGVARIPWGEVPCQENPRGKGFLLKESEILGSPLPNLEDPRAPLRAPLERPQPLAPCPYPLEGGLRATLFDRSDPDLSRYDHLFFNNAHPHFTLSDGPAPGTPITIDGVKHEGALSLRVPAFAARAMALQESEHFELPMRLDTIIILADEGRAVFRWRGGTTFRIRPRERRSLCLIDHGVSA